MSEPPPVLWRPARAGQSRLAEFAGAVGLPVDYPELYRWSLEQPEGFWRAVWEFCGVRGEPGDRVRVDGPAGEMLDTTWFPEARLNFAENLLAAGAAAGAPDGEAVVYLAEDGFRRSLTHGELDTEVRRTRAAMQRLGIRAGDRVAAMLPNVPEAVVAMLAAASLGAIWSSCSPDFGNPGVLDRFAQIGPKLLLVPDTYLHKGRWYDQGERLDDLLQGLPGVERVVVVPCGRDPHPVGGGDRVQGWHPFRAGVEPDGAAFERFPFDQPLYVMFSSGTTGRPKCIVHGAGGTLLQHLKEHQLHCDLGEGDRLLYFTTTGWMMWNWLVSALASGTTILLFDGHPFTPGPGALWQVVEREQVTVFGTSAKYLDACKKAGLSPGRRQDLGTLRAILSTGSPLLPETFDWVYAEVKRDLELASISGGTDIISCFALGCPLLPVRRGELTCRGLGMRVEVFDADGAPLVDSAGELVCTAPFPSMPVGFWGDDAARSRYRAAYFERFPGAWHHGDWATLTSRGSLRISGRSDATLNPGGVRIGTAEIYRQVEQLPEIAESIAVGQEREGDERVVLFVVLRGDAELDDGLRDRIRRAIREGATPRHVPAVIAAVTDLPRTRSGKISELAVRDVVHGRRPKNTHALQDPEVLQQFADRPELA